MCQHENYIVVETYEKAFFPDENHWEPGGEVRHCTDCDEEIDIAVY